MPNSQNNRNEDFEPLEFRKYPNVIFPDSFMTIQTIATRTLIYPGWLLSESIILTNRVTVNQI